MQVSEILSEIDNEIARLQEARRLLAGENSRTTRTRGRKPGAVAAVAAAAPKKRRRRRKLTPEGRKKLSEALKARWAERKKKAGAKASK